MSPSLRHAGVVLALLALVVGAAIFAHRKSTAAQKSAVAQPAAEVAATAHGRRATPSPQIAPAQTSVPRYGRNPREFIHQRHDYPPDTPERLGPKIGRVLFDLETVVDIVASGTNEDGRIREVRGTPLTAAEQQAAQAVLQRFFDEAGKIVDATLDGTTSQDAGFTQLLALRSAMNCGLITALHLNEADVSALWPQMLAMVDARCLPPRPTPSIGDEIPKGHQRSSLEDAPTR